MPAGKIISEDRNLSGFKNIELNNKIDLYIEQSNYFSVRVKCGKNLIHHIITKVENETLKILNKNYCNFLRDPEKKIEVYVCMPKLKYLKHNGSGNIYTQNTFVQDTFILRMETPGDVHLSINTHYFGGSTHGNGDLYLNGSTDYFYYNYNGTNFIYASGLNINQYTYLESHSVGHAYVNLNNIGMDAFLFSNGNIYYTGNPNYLKWKSKGKGSVIKE